MIYFYIIKALGWGYKMNALRRFKEKGKRDKTRFITEWLTRILCIGFIVYCLVSLILGWNEKNGRVANVNVTGIIQALLLFGLTFVPMTIEKVWKIKLPFYIVFLFLAFILASLWCGEIFDFYIHFSWWDDVLHTFSGVYIAAIGFFVVSIVNERRDDNAKLSPGFVQLYAFILALAAECVWEIFEFFTDTLFGSNMQRAYESESFKENGAINDITDPNFNALVGRDALIDTMGDMIEVLIGAFIMCMIGYVMLKYAKVIKEKLNKRRNNKKAVVEEDNQNDDAE